MQHFISDVFLNHAHLRIIKITSYTKLGHYCIFKWCGVYSYHRKYVRERDIERDVCNN